MRRCPQLNLLPWLAIGSRNRKAPVGSSHCDAVASLNTRSFLYHCGHLETEVYPDNRASRMMVWDRFAQRPSTLQHPRSTMFEILADLDVRNAMLDKARFQLRLRQLGQSADQAGDTDNCFRSLSDQCNAPAHEGVARAHLPSFLPGDD